MNMEQVHGIDVSWMTHGSPKDKANKNYTPRRPSVSSPQPRAQPQITTQNDIAATNGSTNGHTDIPSGHSEPTKPIATSRPSFGRTGSSEKLGPNGSSPQRRNSWFTNIQNKFSSSPITSNNQSPAPPHDPSLAKPAPPPVPKVTPAKNAVLQHANKYDGEGPYTPAPPKSAQAGFLGVFRRLSSSGGVLAPGIKGTTHGLVERKVLNVDQQRERCRISDLNQAKLRRVAFSVDVEIAPMPKYSDPDTTPNPAADKTQKRKMTERGEGEALKNPKALEDQKEQDGFVQTTGEPLPKEPEKEGTEACNGTKHENECAAADKAAESKKKEKKKKNEEERKARKEKKRKLAEANGKVPMEIHMDDSDSSADASLAGTGTPKTSAFPTTNPVRIYRRCCQLRETPILKKITEQLSISSNYSSDTGLVNKIDLTGYWLQLPDLVTLGDYLAVVPVKEVIMENCGLTDEGVRVILAGLLAAKKPGAKRRKHCSISDGSASQGGVVERLVLKNNKIGPEGWKHLCLFVHLCRTLKCLDLSRIPFPRSPQSPHPHGLHIHGTHKPTSVATLFSRAIGDRLAGNVLELLNLGDTEPSSEELGTLIDGIIQCGVARLGLAHNQLDEKGLEHVARYLARGFCEGLDLGGNDLRENMEVIAKSITENDPLWALSLADCNLRPGSLCKIFPKLVQLKDFRFIDLSHNHDLCESEPSAVGLLRKYLPKLGSLKRIHLADVAMTSEQAIALAEILPEVSGLAHISFLENPELVKLADAKSEETREEACALYASLLAATRVSSSIVCVDVDVPTEESGEIVKALAKQVVAYCLRNMERLPIAEITSSMGLSDAQDHQTVGGGIEPPYPDVLVHLVGHDFYQGDADTDDESAPDEDYVIGGTGVVKALACCLNNRGDESRRQSGEFNRDFEEGELTTPTTPKVKLPPGKAKDMSKHLLASARKIRIRLQPALSKARSNPDDEHNLRKLMFLDQTLAGIINRFEDEFPDTRLSSEEVTTEDMPTQSENLSTSLSSTEAEPDQVAILSDGEDDTDIHVRPGLSRSNSVLSHSSKALAVEEGRMLRVGHKFRSGIIRPEHYHLLAGLDEVGAEPKHIRMLEEMIEDIGDPGLIQKTQEKGIVRLFKEDRDQIRECLKAVDPDHWERFIESQEKARANVQVDVNGTGKTQPTEDQTELAITD